jgi:hypothetical protein
MKGDPAKEDKELLKRRKILEEPFKYVAVAFIRTTLIVVLIFYLGILLISRTAGFQSIIAERLESQLGVPFEIEGSGFDARLNLHTRGLKSTAPLLEAGHIQVDQLSAFWTVAGLLSKDKPLVHKIILDGVSLQIVATKNNGWQPAVFGVLDEIEGFDNMARPDTVGPGDATKTPAAGELEDGKTERAKAFHSILIVRNSQINLLQGNGRRVANFGNVEFQYVPGYNEGLEVQLYTLDGDYVMLNSKVPRQKLELEVLNAGDEIMVRRLRAGADLLLSLAGFLGGEDVAEELPAAVIVASEPETILPDPALVLETPARVSVEFAGPVDAKPPHALQARIDRVAEEVAAIDPALAATNNVADEILHQIKALFGGQTNDVVSSSSITEAVDVAEIPSPFEPTPVPQLPEPRPLPPLSLKEPQHPEAPASPVAGPDPQAPSIMAPNVVSEIEKILADAMRVQEEARVRRAMAERKFAAISNEYLVISNDLERVVEP